MAYQDLSAYLEALDKAGKLHRITKQVQKDWEVSAVGKRIFQKIPEDERKALLFENVEGFDIPIAAGVLGASRQVYALALETTPERIMEKWESALCNPIPPRQVSSGACKDVILKGDDIDLFKFPVPYWTVGEDPSPYLTAPQVVSMDPDTGLHNVGTYRIQIKARNKTGLWISRVQHMRFHIQKYEERGEPTPVAIVLGTDPSIGIASVAKIPKLQQEYAVAGGVRGEPLELVACETSRLLVPAAAEIVIEGEIPPGYRELEGPFGEYTGYMGPAGDSYVINVTCITHRAKPIFHAFISQMPPSESSTIRGFGREMAIFKHLREELGLPVKDVHLKHAGGASAYLAISLKKQYDGQVQQAMWGAWSVDPTLGKFTVVVDDDIDVRDSFHLDWAISFRVQPAQDVYIVRDSPGVRLDPSLVDASVLHHEKMRITGSKMGIDATKKHAFPPLSLPPREHFERVDESWEAYGFTWRG